MGNRLLASITLSNEEEELQFPFNTQHTDSSDRYLGRRRSDGNVWQFFTYGENNSIGEDFFKLHRDGVFTSLQRLDKENQKKQRVLANEDDGRLSNSTAAFHRNSLGNRQMYFSNSFLNQFEYILDGLGFLNIEFVCISRLFFCQRALCYDLTNSVVHLSNPPYLFYGTKNYNTSKNVYQNPLSTSANQSEALDVSEGIFKKRRSRRPSTQTQIKCPAQHRDLFFLDPGKDYHPQVHSYNSNIHVSLKSDVGGHFLCDDFTKKADLPLDTCYPHALVFLKGYRYFLKETTESLTYIRKRLLSIQSALSWDLHPNVLTHFHINSLPGKMPSIIRLWMSNTMHKISLTACDWTLGEKAWTIFQMICAVAQLHSVGLFHGSLSPSNFVCSDAHHIFLVDIGSCYKPYLIRPNETALAIVTTFFESPDYHEVEGLGLRKPCYLAPERFNFHDHYETQKSSDQRACYPGADQGLPSFSLLCAADIYALGCCIAEFCTNGESMLTFPDSFCLARFMYFNKHRTSISQQNIPFVFPSDAYVNKASQPTQQNIPWFLPKSSLSSLKDQRILDLIMLMCSPDYTSRPTACQCLEIGQTCGLFPSSFFSILMPLTTLLLHPLLQPDNLCSFFLHKTLLNLFPCLTENDQDLKRLNNDRTVVGSGYLDPLSFYHNLASGIHQLPLWINRERNYYFESSKLVDQQPPYQDSCPSSWLSETRELKRRHSTQGFSESENGEYGTKSLKPFLVSCRTSPGLHLIKELPQSLSRKPSNGPPKDFLPYVERNRLMGIAQHSTEVQLPSKSINLPISEFQASKHVDHKSFAHAFNDPFTPENSDIQQYNGNLCDTVSCQPLYPSISEQENDVSEHPCTKICPSLTDITSQPTEKVSSTFETSHVISDKTLGSLEAVELSDQNIKHHNLVENTMSNTSSGHLKGSKLLTFERVPKKVSTHQQTNSVVKRHTARSIVESVTDYDKEGRHQKHKAFLFDPFQKVENREPSSLASCIHSRSVRLHNAQYALVEKSQTAELSHHEIALAEGTEPGLSQPKFNNSLSDSYLDTLARQHTQLHKPLRQEEGYNKDEHSNSDLNLYPMHSLLNLYLKNDSKQRWSNTESNLADCFVPKSRADGIIAMGSSLNVPVIQRNFLSMPSLEKAGAHMPKSFILPQHVISINAGSKDNMLDFQGSSQHNVNAPRCRMTQKAVHCSENSLMEVQQQERSLIQIKHRRHSLSSLHVKKHNHGLCGDILQSDRQRASLGQSSMEDETQGMKCESIFQAFMSYWKCHHYLSGELSSSSLKGPSFLTSRWMEDSPLPYLNHEIGFMFSKKLLESWNLGYSLHCNASTSQRDCWMVAIEHLAVFHFSDPEILKTLHQRVEDLYQGFFSSFSSSRTSSSSLNPESPCYNLDDPCGISLLKVLLRKLSDSEHNQETILHYLCSLLCILQTYSFSFSFYLDRIIPVILQFLHPRNNLLLMQQALIIISRCLDKIPGEKISLRFFLKIIFPCVLELLEDSREACWNLAAQHLPFFFSLLAKACLALSGSQNQDQFHLAVLRFFQSLLAYDKTQVSVALLRATSTFPRIFTFNDLTNIVLPFLISFMNSNHMMIRVVFCLSIFNILDVLIHQCSQEHCVFPTPQILSDFWSLASPLFPCFESALEDSDELVIEAALEGLVTAFDGSFSLWHKRLHSIDSALNLLAFHEKYRWRNLAQQLGEKTIPLLYHPNVGISTASQRLLSCITHTCFYKDPVAQIVSFHPLFLNHVPFKRNPTEPISVTLKQWSIVFSRKLFYYMGLLSHEDNWCNPQDIQMRCHLEKYLVYLKPFLKKSFKRISIESLSNHGVIRLTSSAHPNNSLMSKEEVVLIPDSFIQDTWTRPYSETHSILTFRCSYPKCCDSGKVKVEWSEATHNKSNLVTQNTLLEPSWVFSCRAVSSLAQESVLDYLLADWFIYNNQALLLGSHKLWDRFEFYIPFVNYIRKDFEKYQTLTFAWMFRQWKVYALGLPLFGPWSSVQDVQQCETPQNSHSAIAYCSRSVSCLLPSCIPNFFTVNEFFRNPFTWVTDEPLGERACFSFFVPYANLFGLTSNSSTCEHDKYNSTDQNIKEISSASTQSNLSFNVETASLSEENRLNDPESSDEGFASVLLEWRPRGIYLATVYPHSRDEQNTFTSFSEQSSGGNDLKLEITKDCALLVAGVKRSSLDSIQFTETSSTMTKFYVYDCQQILTKTSNSCVDILDFSTYIKPSAFTLLSNTSSLLIGTTNGSLATYRLDSQKFDYGLDTRTSYGRSSFNEFVHEPLNVSQPHYAVTSVTYFETSFESVAISAHENGDIVHWDFRSPSHSGFYTLPHWMGKPIHLLASSLPYVLHIATLGGYLITLDLRYSCAIQVLQASLNGHFTPCLCLRPITMSLHSQDICVSLASHRNDVCIVNPLTGFIEWGFFSSYATDPVFYNESTDLQWNAIDPYNNILRPEKKESHSRRSDISDVARPPGMDTFALPVFRCIDVPAHRAPTHLCSNHFINPLGKHHATGNVLDLFTWNTYHTFHGSTQLESRTNILSPILTAGTDRCIRYLSTKNTVQEGYLVTSPHSTMSAVYSPLFEWKPSQHKSQSESSRYRKQSSFFLERLHLNGHYLSLSNTNSNYENFQSFLEPDFDSQSTANVSQDHTSLFPSTYFSQPSTPSAYYSSYLHNNNHNCNNSNVSLSFHHMNAITTLALASCLNEGNSCSSIDDTQLRTLPWYAEKDPVIFTGGRDGLIKLWQ